MKNLKILNTEIIKQQKTILFKQNFLLNEMPEKNLVKLCTLLMIKEKQNLNSKNYNQIRFKILKQIKKLNEKEKQQLLKELLEKANTVYSEKISEDKTYADEYTTFKSDLKFALLLVIVLGISIKFADESRLNFKNYLEELEVYNQNSINEMQEISEEAKILGLSK